MIRIHLPRSEKMLCGECGRPGRNCRCFQQHTDKDRDFQKRAGRTKKEERSTARDEEPIFSLR